MNKDNGSRKKSDSFPSFFSHITLRQERFGGIVFNPYSGVEEELDNIEYFIAAHCNGHNSSRQIEAEAARHFGYSARECKERVSSAIKKLLDIHAINTVEIVRQNVSMLPHIEEYPEEGPYYSAPKQVSWDITYACNLSCPHCLTASGRVRKNELNTEEALAVIDMLADEKVLSLLLIGGEPFLRPDIMTLLRHISGTNMRLEIATNGLVLPEMFLRAIRDIRLSRVQLSIDGIGDRHDRFRGRKGAFRAACDSARTLRQNGIDVMISTTLTSENSRDIKAIIELAVEFGCSGVKLVPFIPIGRGKKYADRLMIDAAGYLQLSRTLREMDKKWHDQINIYLENCFTFLLEPPPVIRLRDGPMGCSAGLDTLCIGADGTAYPCPFLRDFPLGNFKSAHLKDVWKTSKDLLAFRTLRKKDMQEPCRTCIYAPILCHGGCRAAAYIKNHDILSVDPSCFRSRIEI